MADRSGIQWTDASWNPVTGCSKVSPGCAHCYAETVALRFWPTQYPKVERETIRRGAVLSDITMGPRQFTDVQCHEDRLDQPLRWKKPRKVFVNSMSDLFHESVPDVFIDRVFAVMALAPRHTFQILTKRAERMHAYMRRHDVGQEWLVKGYLFSNRTANDWAYQESDAAQWTREGLPNVWLGVSVENQHFADERIPLLLQTPAAVRFISAEPLLGPIDLTDLAVGDAPDSLDAFEGETCSSESSCLIGEGPGLDWVIVGGESGADARSCSQVWIRGVVQQCRAAGVPVFVKQIGRVSTYGIPGVNGGFAPKDRKGGDITEWPEDLRVREFPCGR